MNKLLLILLLFFATARTALAASPSATLNGSVNPNGLATTAWFRWGIENTSCGSLPNQTSSQSVGSGTSYVTYSQTISNLSSGTKYYFCAQGQNATGTTSGSVLSFVTLLAPPDLEATAEGNQINLSWGGSAGAASYKVERCVGLNCSSFTQIANPTTVSYLDKDLVCATAYTYRVRASAGSVDSDYSNTAFAQTSLFQNLYDDKDTDGYGSGSPTQTTNCTPPVGKAFNNQDCYDLNANARPGQKLYFGIKRGDVSFDYDCDSETTSQYPSYGHCLGSSATLYKNSTCTTSVGVTGFNAKTTRYGEPLPCGTKPVDPVNASTDCGTYLTRACAALPTTLYSLNGAVCKAYTSSCPWLRETRSWTSPIACR